MAAAALTGALLSWLTPLRASGRGLAGTLVLAAIKRERGVRDWSHLIPGQGGVLDQWGGVFFAAPLFYRLTHYGWA